MVHVMNGSLTAGRCTISTMRGEAMMHDIGLGDYVDKPVKSLSKGMAQTVQLFGTIVHHPRLIVLDEPFTPRMAIAVAIIFAGMVVVRRHADTSRS